MQQGTWTIRPCPHTDTSALAEALGISWLTASVLVRRGHCDPETARAFLAAEPPRHDAALLGDTAAACDRLRGAIKRGERICVHGDYDVDGICATALAVLCLRERARVRVRARTDRPRALLHRPGYGRSRVGRRPR